MKTAGTAQFKANTERMEVAAKLFDSDGNRKISPDEQEKWVLKYITQFGKGDSSALGGATPGDAEIETKAIAATERDKRILENYWSKQKASANPGSTYSGLTGGADVGSRMQASSYEQAVQMIEQTITDPARKQQALQAAKQTFGIQ